MQLYGNSHFQKPLFQLQQIFPPLVIKSFFDVRREGTESKDGCKNAFVKIPRRHHKLKANAQR